MTQDLTSRESVEKVAMLDATKINIGNFGGLISVAAMLRALLAAKEQAEWERDNLRLSNECFERASEIALSDAEKAEAQRDALKALCDDAVIVIQDTSAWLVRSNFGGTAHQLHLDEFATRAAELLAQWGMK